jgi:hypothetical protein
MYHPFWSSALETTEPQRLCDELGCSREGGYPAPKSPADLRERYYFCLDHVREYNAQWNYYAGMSESEALNSRLHDITWERPSWPFGNGRRAEPFSYDFSISADSCEIHLEFSSRASAQKGRWFAPSTPESKALDLLDLTWPFSQGDLKLAYKCKAKEHHPDLNTDTQGATDRFLAIKEAYEVLGALMKKDRA